MSNCSSSRVDNLSERLKQVDFDSPAKIFQNKHAVYQFQSVTPNIATPNSERDEYFQSEGNGGGLSESESGSKTPINDSNAPSFGSSSPEEEAPSKPASTTISRQNTPAQFVFKKPEYNSHYHSTHFHHLEKKDTIFHDLKRFFKKSKSKKKCLQDDASSVRSGASSVYSKASDLSFANEFNKNIEGRYGKWGKFFYYYY
jgi:hypothetical protein